MTTAVRPPKERSIAATSSSRRLVAEEQLEASVATFLAEDLLGSLEDLEGKLKTEKIPSGFVVFQTDDKLWICYFTNCAIPQLRGTIMVAADLTFKVTLDGKTAVDFQEL